MLNPEARAVAVESLAGLEYATCSHVGLKRNINQDSFQARLASEPEFSQHGHLFVVADGMGAHAAGELASQLAVEEVSQASGPDTHDQQLKDHFQKANAIIHERGQSNPQLYNMGTTCSALWLLRQGALVGHVGDSRVYRCREGRIEQLTFDHSLVWEMRAAGQYSADSANSVPRNVITRCLGPHPRVEVDLEGPFSVQPGDTFLLCSDGLTGRITDAELGVVLRYLPTVDAAEFLVDLANLRGGHDNITVTIVRILDEQLRAFGSVALESATTTGTKPFLWVMAGFGMLCTLAAFGMNFLPGIAAGATLFGIATIAILAQWMRHRRDARASGGLPTPPYALASTELTDRILQEFMVTLASPASTIRGDFQTEDSGNFMSDSSPGTQADTDNRGSDEPNANTQDIRADIRAAILDEFDNLSLKRDPPEVVMNRIRDWARSLRQSEA